MELDDLIVSKAIIERFSQKMLNYLEVDVAIVGAGPAGLTASYALAKKGFKVGIMDVVLMHREFVTVQHDMIEALTELHKARIEVELSVGGEVR